MEDDNEIDLAEYSIEKNKSKFVFLGKKMKPTNTLEYMRFQSEDYLKYKLQEKIKLRIKCLNLEEKYVNEIVELCNFYYNQFKKNNNKIRISYIIPIVTYKIVKKNKIPLSHTELIDKLKIDRGKFLAYSQLIKISDSSLNIKEEIKNEQFEGLSKNSFIFVDKVYEYVVYLISKLFGYYKYKPNSFKYKNTQKLLDKCVDNLYSLMEVKLEKTKIETKSSLFIDIFNFLEETQVEAKIFINSDKSKFYDFFNDKILIESLAAGIIKYIMDTKGIKINLKVFNVISNISLSGISKSMKMLIEYINIYKTINKSV